MSSVWVVISGFHAFPCDDAINLEGRRRALGDKALFSNLIITLQEKRREKENKRGGHAGPSLGRGSSRSTSVATGDENPAPFVHRPREKKLEISRGKRKHP